jgi:hypothetical protein
VLVAGRPRMGSVVQEQRGPQRGEPLKGVHKEAV